MESIILLHDINCLLVNLDQSYYVAETTMPGRSGFDFNGSSQSFNVLASYLFGKVVDTVPPWVRVSSYCSID
jgi:hypothetical protein